MLKDDAWDARKPLRGQLGQETRVSACFSQIYKPSYITGIVSRFQNYTPKRTAGMDILKTNWSFKDSPIETANESVKIAFLGTRHPHVMYRFAVLEKMGALAFSGFYEEDSSIAAELAKRLPRLQCFNSPAALLDTNPDVVMIHSLDPDVPRWARFAINHPAPFKGLFLEKPGAAQPGDFYALASEIAAKRPGLAIELGYEMHYSESL